MPVEPLHSLENGLILDLLKILFYEIMTNKLKNSTNKLERKISYMDRQKYLSLGANKDMPGLDAQTKATKSIFYKDNHLSNYV